MKRISLLIVAICYSAALVAQTPQELKLLRERVNAFAYATQAEQVDTNSCKITLSSGDSFILCSGSDKAKCAFKLIDVNKEAITAKPHKGKPIVIGRKPNQEGALIALFKATNGKKWSRKSGWGDTKQGIYMWAGITCNKQGEVTHIKLSDNNLQGALPDVFYAFPKLKELALNKNQITGKLPRSMAWLPEECTVNVQFNKLALTTFYVPLHRISAVGTSIRCYPQQPEHNDFRLFVDCDVDLNPVNGYYADNECRLYHKATEGAGINIYIVGEGYDKAEYAKGGTAEYWLERAADAVFDIKPYNQMKHLFNVYIVYAYSQERGIGLFDNPRNCRFECWQKTPTRRSETKFNAQTVFDVCRNSATKAGYQFEKGTVYVEMVVNSTNNGLYRALQRRRYVNDGDQKRYMRTAINPTYPRNFNSLIWHEFGGHAFGYLLDEYSPKRGKNKIYDKGPIDRANLDTESDPKKIKWAQFIADPRYAEEKIGVYKGGLSCSNVYRSTENSIMRRGGNTKLRFNAPSRAEIYRRAMELAYPGWKFDYEEFVKFDMGDKYYPLENNK